MDLMKMGAELFLKNIGGSGSGLDAGKVTSALSGLLPTDGGQLNMGSLISQLNSGGLATLASSWLGSGSNDGISADQILGMFGQSKVENFASALDLDANTAASGLSNMLPDLIDKNSEGGELMDVAKGVLSKLF